MSLHRLTRSLRHLLTRTKRRTQDDTRRRTSARLQLVALEDRSLMTANATGTITGVAFLDTNGNNRREANEPVIAGAPMQLFGRTDQGRVINVTGLTGVAGGFKFSNVSAGMYHVVANSIGGYTPSSGGPAIIINSHLEGGETLGATVAYKGLPPANVSLVQFLNSTTIVSFQPGQPGPGVTPVNPRENNAPEVIATPRAMTIGKNAADSNVNLKSIFTDPDLNSRVQIDTNYGNIDIELFDDQSPDYVENFINYITSNRYDDTFFHRLGSFLQNPANPAVRDVLQGGGFKFTSGPNGTSTVTAVRTDASVRDAVLIPNTKGTISMAKGSTANSATSQFFFNLVDNTDSLSPTGSAGSGNGGFTVFGKIDPKSQAVIDKLAAFNIQNKSSANGALTDLPLLASADPTFPGKALASDFAYIRDVRIVRRPQAVGEALTYKVIGNTNTGLVTTKVIKNNLTLDYTNNATGTARITVRATDRFGIFVDTQFNVTVANNAPSATVTLAPSSPMTNDLLTATATATDPNGDAVHLTYVWKKRVNGVDTVLKTTVYTSNLTDTFNLATDGSVGKGDTILVDVLPSDGIIDGTVVSASKTVLDTPPVISLLSFNPSTPSTDDLLTVTTTASDADGEAITYTYTWFVDNVQVKSPPSTASLTDSLDLSIAGNGNPGQTVRVEVVPTAGGVSGTKVTKSVVIDNKAPQISSVTLTPASPGTDNTLTANVVASDPDGTTPTFKYEWKVNDVVVKTTSGTSNVTDSLNLSLAGNGSKGDTVTVTVTPNDGLVNGVAKVATTTIADSPPAISNLVFNLPTPGTNDTLSVTTTAADPDNDPMTFTYVWKVNDNIVRTETDVDSLSVFLNLSEAGNGDTGDVIKVEVTPKSGALTGDTKTLTTTIV